MSRRKRDKKKRVSQPRPTESSPPTRRGRIASRAVELVRNRWVPPAALVVLTLAVYARSVSLPLINWDDHTYLLEDPQIQEISLRNFWRILTCSFFANYHPITTLTYAVDRAIWGFWLPGFHLTQLAFYVCGVVLLYYLFRSLLASPWAAFAAATIYATHAIHVEAVAWLAQRKDVVCLVFYVGSILTYVRYARDDKRSLKLYAASVALALAAMLSKGYAVVLPAVLLAYDACFGRRIGRRQLLDKVPFLVLAVATTILTVVAQDKDSALVPLDIARRQRFAVLCEVFAFYVGRTILPVRLSANYAVQPGWLNPGAAVLGALLGAGSIAGFLVLRRRLPAAAFGVALFVLPLGTVMNVFFTLTTWMADRYLFFPTIGSSLALVAGGIWLWRGAAARESARRWAIPAAAVLAAGLYAVLTVARIGAWTSAVALWSDAVRRQLDLPGSGPVVARELRGRKLTDVNLVVKLAKAYERSGRREEARALMSALGAAPRAVTTDNALYFAAHHINSGRYDKAIRTLRTIAEKGDYAAPSAWILTGTVYKRKGDLDEARAAYRKALELLGASGRPGVPPMLELGLLEFEAGRFEEAARWYRRAREADPSDPRPVFNLGLSLERSDGFYEAYRLYEETLAFRGRVPPKVTFGFANVHKQMGVAAEALGRLKESIRHLKEALNLAPDHPQRPDIRLKIGLIEERLGRIDEAIRNFEEALELVPDHPDARAIRARIKLLRQKGPPAPGASDGGP